MINNPKAMYQVMRDAKLPQWKLKKIIHKRLKEVLVSGYLNVPYYQKVMKHIGYNPLSDYSGPKDLARLPITTKEIIKQRGIKEYVMKGSDLSSCFSSTTSGSTGIPFRTYRSPHERSIEIAKWLRVLFINGYSVWNKVMYFRFFPNLTEQRHILQRFGILRRRALDYFLSPGKKVNNLLNYRPDVLYGAIRNIILMAMEMNRLGIRPDFLKLLIGTGEVIHESDRRLCRDNFGVELTETYGSIELGVMAYETPAHDGLHLCEDLTYFEFLDEEGTPVSPGKTGRIIVTDLTSKLMPFIRYDQGDLAVYEQREVTTGVKQKRILRIIGRDNDFLSLPDGNRLAGHKISGILCEFEDIIQFRLVQKTRYLIHIQVVADKSYLSSIYNDLKSRLENEFPPDVKFKIIHVPRIEPDPSGKIRMIISEVKE